MKEIRLIHKDDICPLSGIGKPPEQWSRCVFPCGFYDATSGECAVKSLWRLRELPEIARVLDNAADTIAASM